MAVNKYFKAKLSSNNSHNHAQARQCESDVSVYIASHIWTNLNLLHNMLYLVYLQCCMSVSCVLCSNNNFLTENNHLFNVSNTFETVF